MRAVVWLFALSAGTALAQPLPPAPASGAKSGQGGSVDRFADALLFASATREAEALRRIRTLTMDLDEGVVFWRITPPEAPLPRTLADASGAWPLADCRVIGPEIYVEPEVFCTSVLGFFAESRGGAGSGSGDESGSGGIGPYEITYHERTWGGRPAHGFSLNGLRGRPLAEGMDTYEMWVDAETLVLVLMRTTGSDVPGEAPVTFSFERSDLRQVKGLTVAHHYRTTLYGAAPGILAAFTDEDHADLALVRDALDAPDPLLAIEALPEELRESVGFYEAVLTNGPLEWEYTVREMRVNQPVPTGVFGGFGR